MEKQTQNKLKMVNRCLRAIGEVPLLDTTVVDNIQIGSDADIASRIIDEEMENVQARGWFFNTEYNLRLVPDSRGFITMPPNTLRMDVGNNDGRHRYILKENRVYDNLKQTFKIDTELKADVIWFIKYEDLSVTAFEYIAARSARKFQAQVIGSLETDGLTARDEQDAFVQLQREQLQTQDYRLQNHKVNTRLHNGYLVSSLYGTSSRRDY